MTEAVDLRSIPLDPPAELRPDQNFFDQEPFRSVLQVASQRTGADIARLQRLLVIEARLKKLKMPKEKVPSSDEERAIGNAVEELEPYKGWFEYVDLVMNPHTGYGLYKKDGEVISHLGYKSTGKLFPPNYSEWLKRKREIQRRAKDQRLVGIDEVFARGDSIPEVGETERVIRGTSARWATKKHMLDKG